MHDTLRLLIFLFVLTMCIGCNSTIWHDRITNLVDEKGALWVLEFGAYTSTGTLIQITPQKWQYISKGKATSATKDQITFNFNLDIEIKNLNYKSLDYKIINQINYPDKKSSKLVLYEGLIFTAMTCQQWRMQAFTMEQICNATMPHVNHKVVNSFGSPTKISVWLPYLNQELTLTYIDDL